MIALTDIIYEVLENDMVYHLTKTSNVPNIRTQGLKPSIPTDMPTEEEGVYVFKTKEDAENALMNWYGERYEDDDEEFSLLTIDITGLRLFATLADYEYISYEAIPPSNIIKIEDI